MELTICYCIIYLIEALILWQYATNLLRPKYNRCYEGLLLLCLYSILLFIFSEQSFLINTTSFLIANFIFLIIMYHLKWYSALFHASITTIVMGMSELIVLSIMSHFAPDFFAERNYFRNLVILTIFDFIFYSIIICLV